MKALHMVLLFASVGACTLGDEGESAIGRRHVDAGVVVHPADAAPTPPPPPGTPGVIACFTEGNPNQTCSGGVACNFNAYNSYHDGYCSSTASWTYGLETCDGPEDCSSAGHCCNVLTDTGDGFLVKISCQAQACPAGIGNSEMCHPTSNARGTCSDATKHCVTARAAGNYMIAANLYVCQ